MTESQTFTPKTCIAATRQQLDSNHLLRVTLRSAHPRKKGFVSPFVPHFHHFSSTTIFLPCFVHRLIFVTTLFPFSFPPSAFFSSLYLHSLAAILMVEMQPQPSGHGGSRWSGQQKVLNWTLCSWTCPTSNPRGCEKEHTSQARWEPKDRIGTGGWGRIA